MSTLNIVLDILKFVEVAVTLCFNLSMGVASFLEGFDLDRINHFAVPSLDLAT